MLFTHLIQLLWGSACWKRYVCALLLCLWSAVGLRAQAQQLDLEFLPKGASASKPFLTSPVVPAVTIPALPESLPNKTGALTNPDFQSVGKPLTATVSKTLYLPPAMYGQWTVTGTVRETNISGLVPVANDIWVLQREGDLVTITNPVNGASASIEVDAVDGNTATFHRSGQSNRVNRSETVTLTVNGDTLYGKNLRREEVIRKGQVVKVNYAVFELQGTRIGGARAVFRPQALESGPFIEIDEVRRAR